VTAINPPTPVPETSLLERLRRQEPEAYETFVRENIGRMLTVARRFLKNDEDAQDAVQEAFLSAFKSIDRFEGDSKLSTWLHRIVVNAALMKLRTKKRKPEESIEDLLPNFLENGHLNAPNTPWKSLPVDVMIREENRRHVREAIDQLPESYRNVLLMRDIEGLNTTETAELLGISENATKVRLHRARQALTTLLEPIFHEDAES